MCKKKVYYYNITIVNYYKCDSYFKLNYKKKNVSFTNYDSYLNVERFF